MKNTRIIELLKTFSEKEINGLEDFISSKYFNKNEIVIKLFLILKKHYPEFESEELLKEKIFAKIFGKKKYEDEKIRTLISNLMKLCKRFLIQVDLEARGAAANIHLLKQLRKREQTQLFQYEYNKMKTAIDETYYKEREYNEVRFVMEDEHYQSNPTGISDKDLQSPFIDDIAYYFKRIMMIELLDINYHKLTRKRKLNYTPEFLYLDVIKENIQKEDFSDSPIIPLKYYIFMSIYDFQNEEYYEKAEKIYYDNIDRISDSEKASINIGLVNYCWIKITTGDTRYFRKAFDLYLLALEKGMYFYENKFLLPSIFTNITKCASYLKELKWLFSFIYEYKNKLHPDQRKEIMDISYSKYYCDIKDFDNALRHINKINPSNSLLKLDIKILGLKIFYELDYIENIYSSIDSIKHFIRSNKIIHRNLIDQSTGFAKYVKKLVDLREKKDKKELEYMKKEIQQVYGLGLINMRWLVEKIDEILEK